MLDRGTSIDTVAETVYHHLRLSPDEIAQTAVNFLFEFKLYAIECPRVSFFMRGSLIVDSHFKTFRLWA